jgi:hypothetical protein
MVCEQFALCSLGCGWLSRAEFGLGYELWQVGSAVPDDGVGGLFGVAGHFNVEVATPNLYQC